MARKEIGVPLDRENLKKHNDNYEELYGVVNNFVGTITDEVYEQIIDGSKLIWKEPVDTSNDLPSDASEGDTRMARDTGKVYRFDGSNWQEIQQIDAGPVNEVDERLTAQLADETQQRKDDISGLQQNKASIAYVNDLADNKADKGALAQGLGAKRDKDVEIGMSDLDQETREAFSGGSVAVVGEDSVGTDNLRDSAVTGKKMNVDYAIKYPYLSDETIDLDYEWRQGNYIVSGPVKNNPFGTGCTLTIERHKTTEGNPYVWITQTISVYGTGSEVGATKRRLLRIREDTSEIGLRGDWLNLNIPDGKVTGEMLDDNYAIGDQPYLSDNTFDLDYIWEQGNYIINESVENNPLGVGCTLKNERFKVDKLRGNTWITQTLTAYGASSLGTVLSRIMLVNEDTNSLVYTGEWKDLSSSNNGDSGVRGAIKILTIGNSFGLDATKYIHKICESAGIDVISGNLYISGGLLEDHYDNITNNENAYRFYRRYHVDDTLTDDYLTDYSVDDALNLYEWDYVFLNQASSQSGVYDTFQPYLNNIITYVKRKQPNAKISLMPTWSYSSDFDDTRFDEYDRDQLTMYNDVLDAYKNAMSDTEFDVIIPSGTAVQNARTDDFMMGIERDLTRDGYHLSDAGCFIAGLTLFRSLINKIAKVDYVPPTVSRRVGYFGNVAVNNALANPFRLTEI